MRYFCFLLCMSSLTQVLGPVEAFAESPVYFVDDGAGLRPVYTGKPTDMQVDEWQVRLYRRGMPTGGSDYWGLISRKSADECMSDLKACQANELASARSMGYSESRDVLTYFNFLGPIAKVRPSKSTGRQLLDAAGIVKRMRSAWKQARTLHSTDSKGANPYANVGKVVDEYLKNLTKAQGKLSELEKKLAITDIAEEDINSALADLGRDLDRADSAYKSFQAMTGDSMGGKESEKLTARPQIPPVPTNFPKRGDKNYDAISGCNWGAYDEDTKGHVHIVPKQAYDTTAPHGTSIFNGCYRADGTLHYWEQRTKTLVRGTHGHRIVAGVHINDKFGQVEILIPEKGWQMLDYGRASPSDHGGATESVDDSPTAEASMRQDTGEVQMSNSLEQIQTEVAAIIRQNGTFLKEEQNQKTQYDTNISWPSPGLMRIEVTQVGSFKFSSGWSSGGGNIKTVDLSLRDVQRVDLETLAGFNLNYVSLLAREGKAFRLTVTSMGTNGEPESGSSAVSDDFHCMIPVVNVEVGQSLAQAIRSAVDWRR